MSETKLSERIVAAVATGVPMEALTEWAAEVAALEQDVAAALVERGQADRAYAAAAKARVAAESLAATLRARVTALVAALPRCAEEGCFAVATADYTLTARPRCDAHGHGDKIEEFPWAAIVRDIEREGGGENAR
jgi:hypothetical protein